MVWVGGWPNLSNQIILTFDFGAPGFSDLGGVSLRGSSYAAFLFEGSSYVVFLIVGHGMGVLWKERNLHCFEGRPLPWWIQCCAIFRSLLVIWVASHPLIYL